MNPATLRFTPDEAGVAHEYVFEVDDDWETCRLTEFTKDDVPVLLAGPGDVPSNILETIEDAGLEVIDS